MCEAGSCLRVENRKGQLVSIFQLIQSPKYLKNFNLMIIHSGKEDILNYVTLCSLQLSLFLYFTGCRNNNSTASSNNAYNVNSSQPLASYNIGSLSSGTGAGAITMAAAQAVQATAQVKSQRFRSKCCILFLSLTNPDRSH